MVQVERKVDVGALLRKGCVFGRRIREREWISSRKSSIGLGETACRRREIDLVSPWGSVGPIPGGERLRRVEKDAVRDANAHFSIAARIPCKTEPGREPNIV